jgi:hypothetical protein
LCQRLSTKSRGVGKATGNSLRHFRDGDNFAACENLSIVDTGFFSQFSTPIAYEVTASALFVGGFVYSRHQVPFIWEVQGE